MNKELVNKIENLLSSLKETKYSGTFLAEEDNGIYHTNCSAIILHLLEKVGEKIPHRRAYEIYEYFKASDHYVFDDINQLRPGDIIVWRKNVIPNTGDSGHVCIFMNLVEIKEREAMIRIFDAARDPHDNDGRETGVGIGDLKLLHSSQKVKGFVWSSLLKKTKFTDIIFVRLNSQDTDTLDE